MATDTKNNELVFKALFIFLQHHVEVTKMLSLAAALIAARNVRT
jgi:hypothetical protein